MSVFFFGRLKGLGGEELLKVLISINYGFLVVIEVSCGFGIVWGLFGFFYIFGEFVGCVVYELFGFGKKGGKDEDLICYDRG